jgi:hypothetical protein
LVRVRNMLLSNERCLQSHYIATGVRAKIYRHICFNFVDEYI